MTYRVVQVTDDQLEATADGTGAVSVVSTAAFAGAPQAVAQVGKHTVGTAADVRGWNDVERRWPRERRETYAPDEAVVVILVWAQTKSCAVANMQFPIHRRSRPSAVLLRPFWPQPVTTIAADFLSD